MRRPTPVVAVLAALLALVSALAVAAEPPSTALRRLAATAAADPSCPRAALYIIPALPNVKDAGVFQLVRAMYIDTVKRLAPAGAISNVIPFSTEPNRVKGGILVHTIVLFRGSCEAGKAGARNLHVKLLGDVRPLFYVPAPHAKSLFGDVYMVTVGFPYLADGRGRELLAPAAPAGTNLAAQFSITWWDTPPSKIGERQAAAFKAAILKQLPAGAGVYFTTMITQGVSYRYGSYWRANAAPVSPTIAKTAGTSSQGSVVWPPGQPADVKSGRLVFNTNIHGTVFNTAAGKQTLAAFLDGLRRSTAAVFPPRTFGAMVLNGGSGLRLVNDASFPCSCETAPAPVLVSAQGFGPYSATAAAAGAANVTWVKWRFTATPTSGAALVQEGDSPLVWWYNLAADTSYTIRVTGITSAGQEAAGSNSLVVRTGRLGAPTLAAASPTGPTTALVYISPPTRGTAVTRFMVSACLKAAPSSCVAANGTSSQVAVAGLAAGASYTVLATAVVGSSLVPASNSLSLTMAPAGAPTLLTATATSAVTGAATAAAPNGVTFKQYTFTAQPPNGGAKATSTVTNPSGGRFTGLKPATLYDVAVVGRNGKASPASNTLTFVTPAANAPLISGTARSAAVVVVSVSPPSLPPANGGTWAAFDVTLCPVSGPRSACATQRIRSAGRRLLLAISTATFSGRTANTIYNFASVAISSLSERSGLSVTGQVATPADIPPPLVKVGSITPTSAVATVTPPATDRPWNSYTLTLCVKGTLDCTTTTCAAVADANSPTNCTLSSLSAGVTYTVTASARRSDGTQSPDSEPAQFTTLTYAPPKVAVTSVGSTSAVVTVTPPALGRPWASYSLTVCLKGSQSCNTTTCRAAASPNASTDCPVGGLSMGATYTVAASARQSGGAQTPPSAAVQFTTVVYPAPSVAVSNITSVTAVATVTPPATGRPWASYSLTVCVKGTQTCNTTTCTAVAAPNSPTSCPLTKLSMGATYTVTATARRSDGSLSQPSAAVQFKTVVYPPPTVVVSSITPTSALATVTPPATGRPWTSYTLTLCAKATAKCTTLNCTAVAAANSPTNCSLTSLEMGLTYTLTTSARRASDGMISPESQAVQFTTPVYPAPSIIVVNIGITTADVSVAPPATAPDGGWAKYVLTLCRVGGSCSKQDCTAVSGRATRTLCALTGLVKNTNYTVSAAAVNGTISSKQSAEKAFKTSNQDGPTIVSVDATYYDAVGCVKAPLEGGPWAAFNCSLCQGTKCTNMPACPIGARRRRLAADTTCTSECYLPELEASTAYKYSCVAVSANNQVVTPKSNVLAFETLQASAPEVEMDLFDPVTAQCWAPSGGPWSVCNMQLCKPAGFVRRLLFGPCASPIAVSCRFPVGPSQVAACSLAGKVEQGVAYNVESQTLKADGTRASEVGSQTGLVVPLFPKPAIQDLAPIAFLRWNMTIYPESNTPLMSYPAGGWQFYRIVADFATGWTETHTCTAQRAGQVPLPTACLLTLQRTGDVTFTATAFQGIPGSITATNLRSAASDPVSASSRRRR